MLFTLVGILIITIGLFIPNFILMLFGALILTMDFLPSGTRKRIPLPKAVPTETRKARHIVSNSPPPDDRTFEFMSTMQAGVPFAHPLRRQYMEMEAKKRGVKVSDLNPDDVLQPFDYALPFMEPPTTNPLRKMFIGYPNYLLRKMLGKVDYYDKTDAMWKKK